MFEELTLFSKQVSILGINFYISRGTTFLVSSTDKLKVLGSPVLGGGLTEARHIINHTVDKDYYNDSPERDLEKVAEGLKLTPDVLGLMTAVDVAHTVLSHANQNGFRVITLCTAGIGNPGVAGMHPGEVSVGYKPGTINLIVLIDGNLTRAAMVNAIVTATEAKTRALFKAKVSLPSGELVTGTTTDSIVIACTGRGQAHRYAGTATEIGYLIGLTVYKAVGQGIASYLAVCGQAYN